MKSVLTQKHFHDEKAAYAYVEARLWATGRACPHCGTVDRSGPLQGKSTRIGVYKCYECRKPFTVKVGTIFESSHIKLHLWLQAIFLICSSKKGISSNQLHRTLGITLKSAWFLSHRIREAMRSGDLSSMGGGGGIVEMDETYFGKRETPHVRNKYLPPPTKGGKVGPGGKRAVVSLVERGGKVRSFHVENADKATIALIVERNLSHEARVFTDESRIYSDIRLWFAEHDTVRHSAKEYVRGEVHTNTVEGVFGVFKKGMKGVYQHCGEKHLHRYLAEFDFRYNNRERLGVDDVSRATTALKGFVGKRLTYETYETARAK